MTLLASLHMVTSSQANTRSDLRRTLIRSLYSSCHKDKYVH